MKQQKANTVCIKRRFLLSQLIEAEQWLGDMANDGRILYKIDGNTYYFHEAIPQKIRYFLLNPEIGTNSDGWVFYECEQEYGIRIPRTGISATSPRLALAVAYEKYCSNPALIEYYYKYRNYRLLHRFRTNIILSSILAIGGVLTAFFGGIYYLLALFPYILGSLVYLAFFVFSYIHFNNSCAQFGYHTPFKKPQRPILGIEK